MIEIAKYSPDMAAQWNATALAAKNSTFLHQREYMDYHSHRFTDCSLVAHDGGRVVALLPANVNGHTLYSHQGLTYGGWLLPAKHFDAAAMLRLWDAMAQTLRGWGIKTVEYKAVPHIYHSYPAEEDLYAIFRAGGELSACAISSAIPLSRPIRFNENARRGLKTAKSAGLTVRESDDFAPFWDVLTRLLGQRYGVSPVHSLDEITLLRSRFPENIRLFTAHHGDGGDTLAGVVVYHTGLVAHAQYIAASPQGKRSGALPLIFDHLISLFSGSAEWLDFGISTEQDGTLLNEGLLRQKAGMGGRGIVYSTYTIKL